MKYHDIFYQAYVLEHEIFLSDINFRFICIINEILNIKTHITFANDYSCTGDRCERLVNLCKQSNANIYLSGPAAKGYLDKKLFQDEGICVEWMDYSGYPQYDQFYPPFEHHVSILDLIFHQGPDAIRYMKGLSPGNPLLQPNY